MIAQLREAKEQLSELVKRAAGGEDIIITVRGQPMARLSSIHPVTTGGRNHDAFADQLQKLADAARCDGGQVTSQVVWDEIREERF
ncbi:MAG: type II toxin-antitoxin system Phd/YefM family antitoxin [Luteolibacter sp.]|jgi:prevent-host-death family protein